MITPLKVHPSPADITIKKCGNEKCAKSYSTLLKCSRCHSQVYCGAECQLADWPQHKKICGLQTTIKESKQDKLSFPLEELKQSTLNSSLIEN